MLGRELKKCWKDLQEIRLFMMVRHGEWLERERKKTRKLENEETAMKSDLITRKKEQIGKAGKTKLQPGGTEGDTGQE